jgi:hypothetical protein
VSLLGGRDLKKENNGILKEEEPKKESRYLEVK